MNYDGVVSMVQNDMVLLGNLLTRKNPKLPLKEIDLIFTYWPNYKISVFKEKSSK